MHSSLELLLLAQVRDGITSPYQLKLHSHLSLGSTVPALNRLKAEGLLGVYNRGARGLREFTITSKGKRVLATEWEKLLSQAMSDTESILRVAFLAWINGASKRAADFLETSAARIQGLSTVTAAEAHRFSLLRENHRGEELRWLRARIETARRHAEAAELLRLAAEMRELIEKQDNSRLRRQTRR